MELFDAKGCLSEEGLQALVGGQLDETQRLEAAEHLAYCDRCMDRYTALLTDDVLEQPPRSARGRGDGHDMDTADAEHMGTRRRGNGSRCAGADAVACRYAGTDLAHRAAAEHMAAADHAADRTGAAGQAGERQSPAAIHRPAGQAHRGQKTADRETIRCTGCAFCTTVQTPLRNEGTDYEEKTGS